MEEQNALSEKKMSQPMRWMAWLLLGVFSVFFAEVSRASAPMVFFDFFGLLITVPLYTLHILVLSPLVIRRGIRPSLGTLFLAGALFGLYEAYITKVLWSPPWNAEAWRIGDVAVIETLVRVLFWHPFLSFIVPLVVADGLLCGQGTLPGWLQTGLMHRIKPCWLLSPVSRLLALARRLLAPARRLLAPARRLLASPRGWMAAVGGLLGILHGATIGEPVSALLSSVISMLLMFLLLHFWQRGSKDCSFSLVDLLPNRREWIVLALLLLADYISLGVVLRQDAFPGLAGHLIVLGMYILFGGLLWLSRRIDQRSVGSQAANPVPANPPTPLFTRQNWVWFSLGFVVLSAVASVTLGWAKDGISVMVWIIGIFLGLFALSRTLWRMIKNRDKIK